MFLIICLVTCILPKVLCEDQPNFVVFLTDDQDLLLHSVVSFHFYFIINNVKLQDYMPKTIKHIANEGVTFTNFVRWQKAYCRDYIILNSSLSILPFAVLVEVQY